MSIRFRVLVGMTVSMLLISLLFLFSLYTIHKTALIKGVDDTLLAVARCAEDILPENYHDTIVDKDSVSPETYLEMIDQYNQLCLDLGLEYIWSLMVVNDQLVFTSSTSTDKVVENGKHALFFDVHTNPEAYEKALRTMEVDYRVNRDKWGVIRMVLVPSYDAHGRKYLFGASMKMDEVVALRKQVLACSVCVIGIIFLIGISASLYVSGVIIEPVIRITQLAKKIAAGDYGMRLDVSGSKELVSLSQSINEMSGAVRNKVVELTASNENLHITLNSIGDGVISTDAEGRVISMNPVAERLTGWEEETARGKALDEVFSVINAFSREPAESPVVRVMKTGKVVGLGNHAVLLSRDGYEYQIADSAAPIRNGDNAIVGVVIVFRDVTEKYKVEKALQHKQRMESVGQLAGGVAHDFNNMLAGIMGSAELLQRQIKGNADAQRNIDRISDSAARAAELTQKLLAFSRKGSVLVEPFDMHCLIDEVCLILERSVDKRIQIEKKLLAERCIIKGDMTQIQSALINLGINARDAISKEGVIRYATENVFLDEGDSYRGGFELASGEYIQISISDNGCGMSAGLRKHIFEPFFTTKERGKGTGLGLAAVYGTVREHNGAVCVYSEQGEGSVFKIYLPVGSASEPVVSVHKKEIVRGSGRILVIDDEEIVLNTVQALLEELGYEVCVMQDAASGLALYEKEKDSFALVILDLVMPGMNGKEVMVKLREINPDVRILLSSGFTFETQLMRFDSRNCGFIQKPYTLTELSQKLATVLNR